MVRALLISCFLFLSGCIGKSVKVMHQQGSLFTNTADFLRSHTEIQTRQIFPLSDNVAQWKLVQRVLKNLGKDPKAYSAVVIESSMINAFAAPNKRFYVTTGLLAMVSTEDELAAVIAHELSHIELKHYESLVDDYRALQIFDILNVYSKEKEYEADLNAIQVMKKSPYQARAMIDFFNKMNAAEERVGTKSSRWFATHPATEDRIKKFENELTKLSIEKEQKPIQSSEDFFKMKDDFRIQQLSYQPKGLYAYEPPRLQVQKDFDQKYAKLHALIVRNQDFDFARIELQKLREQYKQDVKIQAAISLLLARMAYFVGDYGQVEKEALSALTQYPGFSSSLWWTVKIKVAKDQSGKAYTELREIMQSEKCQQNVECLREGAEIAYEYFFDEDDSIEYMNQFIAAISKEKDHEQKQAAEQTASTVAVRAVVENLKEGESEPKRYLPQGIQPSPILQDWMNFEKYSYQNGKEWGNAHRGLYLGLAIPIPYGQRSETTTKIGTSIDVGYRNRLWEGGIFSSNFTHSPVQPSYVGTNDPNKFQISHSGIYAGYHFANRLRYPFMKVKLFGSDVRYNDYSNKAYFSISQGQGFALEYGYNFPGSGGFLFGTWYRMSVEYLQTKLNPYWGTDGSQSYVGVNFELRFSGTYKTNSEEEIFKRPPTFY